MGGEFSQPEASSRSQLPPTYEDARRRQVQPVPVQREAASHNRNESGNLHGRETFNRSNIRKYDSDESGSEAAGNMRIRASKSEKPKKESRMPHNYQDVLEHDEPYTEAAGNLRIQASKPEKPKKESRLPRNHQYALERVDSSSVEKLGDQLSVEVFLDKKSKKYWADKRSNSNSFMLYARELSISWGENQNYWRWLPMEDERGTRIEVAKLIRVCWLEVHGRFNIKSLSPGILYQVSFLVMLEDSAQGWEVPVNFRLLLPGGRKQEHEENLMDMTRMRWIEIPVGEFVATAQDAGEMEISMYEYEGGIWKTGLLIKGVVIKPRN